MSKKKRDHALNIALNVWRVSATRYSFVVEIKDLIYRGTKFSDVEIRFTMLLRRRDFLKIIQAYAEGSIPDKISGFEYYSTMQMSIEYPPGDEEVEASCSCNNEDLLQEFIAYFDKIAGIDQTSMDSNNLKMD